MNSKLNPSIAKHPTNVESPGIMLVLGEKWHVSSKLRHCCLLW